MSDTIYREDAIKALEQRYEDILRIFKRKVKDGEKAIALDMIGCVKSLPSADRPQGEWIPCSERMPSEQGQYLVTFPLCNGEPWVYILSFNKGKFYETDDEWGDVEYDDATAWMPLPKPWKGADDDMH